MLRQGLGHLVLLQLPVRLFEKGSERVRDPVTLGPRPHNIIDAANIKPTYPNKTGSTIHKYQSILSLLGIVQLRYLGREGFVQFHLLYHGIVEFLLRIASQLLLCKILVQQKYDLNRFRGIGVETNEEGASKQPQHKNHKYYENRFGSALKKNVDYCHQSCQKEVSAYSVESRDGLRIDGYG